MSMKSQNQIVLKSSPSSAAMNRRQPLLDHTQTSQTRNLKKSKSNVGEVVGGTTANICVVCCCCPCILIEFVILAVYKVPTTVFRRMWKKHCRNRLLRRSKGSKVHDNVSNTFDGAVNYNDTQNVNQMVMKYVDEVAEGNWSEFEKVKVSIEGWAAAEVVELDKQMWERFKDAGFWRSSSQRF